VLKCDKGEIYLVLSAVFCVLCCFIITQDNVCACVVEFILLFEHQ